MWRFTPGGFPGRALVLVWLSLLVVAGAGQATLVADTHVNAALPTMNSGTISNVNVGGGYTGLLQFDLSLLPTGTTPGQISRAVLRVYVNRMDTAGLVSIAPITSAWGEYSVTYQTIPAMGAAVQVFPVSQAGEFVAVDVTSLVQGWVSAPATNYGVALTAGTAVLEIDSKENDLTGHAATLDVDIVSQGPAGATGPAGPQGISGANGAAGQNGLPGATGPVGATGPAGANGIAGVAGPQGPIGPAGPTGATGPQGATGATGSAGAGGLVYQGTYSATTNYALGDVVLWSGSSYTSLLAGNHGNTPSASPTQWGLLTAQGPAGPTGATGMSGSAGATGASGPMGSPGASGPQGPQGIAGAPGVQGLTGATGAQGATGATGSQGLPGPVGLAFQGPYNSSANYALADGVSWNGSGYVSLIAGNHGNTPDQSPAVWALFAAAGAPGATGSVGPAGLTGPAGPQGLTGATGAVGPQGLQGPQGPAVVNYTGNYVSVTSYGVADAVSFGGSTYVSLVAANHGNTPGLSPAYWAVLAAQGAAGATGLEGPQGIAGAAGVAGAVGAAGPQGPPVAFAGGWLVGTAYAVGDAVSYGGSSYIAAVANSGRQPDVSPAYWGLLALAGSVGATGPAGPTGLQGPTGYAGQVGATGPAGPTGATGPQGPQGATGQTGPQGLAGTNGTNGVNGAAGAQGPPGVAGAQGATGAAGMNFRGAWSSGAGYGVNDAVTHGGSTYLAQAPNNGVQPDSNAYDWAVLAAAGGAGPTGSAGAAASVQVGTVTTGAAGSSASVTNSGTASAAVLNFTIPQGAAGAAGSGGSGGGGGTSGIPYQTMYHSVSYAASYYSVNNTNQSSTETPTVLTWVPNGCSATQLVAFSQQAATITVTLRTGTVGAMSDSALSCSVATGQSCTASGAVAVPAGGFVDVGIYHPDSNPSAVWVAVSCN